MATRRYSATRFAIVLAGAMGMLVVTTTTQAQDIFEWTSAVDGDFADAARWTQIAGGGSAPPGVNDTARFHDFGNYNVTIATAFSAQATVFNGTVIWEGDEGASTYFITSGAGDLLVSAGGFLRIGVLLSTLQVFVADAVSVAGNATLEVNLGSFLSCGDLLVGGFGTGDVWIASAGGLNVNESTSVIDGTLLVGGSATLSGPTAVGVSILGDTTGSLFISDGGVVSDAIQVGGGSASTSSGELLLSGASSLVLTTGSSLIVGGAVGTGSGTVDAGFGTVFGGPVFVEPTGTLVARLPDFQADLSVNGGGLNVGDGFAPGSMNSITNDALWDRTDGNEIEDVVLEDAATVVLTTGSDLITNDVRIGTSDGDAATLRLDGDGTTATQVESMTDAADGLLSIGNETGRTSQLQIANGASWQTGFESVTIAATGMIEVVSGGQLDLRADIMVNGILDAPGGLFTMLPGRSVTVGVGGQVMLPELFDYIIDAGVQWRVLDGATLAMAGPLDVQTGGTFEIAGGTVTVGELEIDGGAFDFSAGSLDITGDLRLDGDETITAAKTLAVGGETTVRTSDELVVDGGVFNGTGLRLLPDAVFEVVSGTASADGPILALGASSILVHTGSVTFGDATAANGFYSNGRLDIFDNSATIGDANDAVFDSAALVMLGIPGGSPGLLTVPNGLTLDFGANLIGFGTVDTVDDPATPLTNNGHIAGFGPTERVDLTGYVKGVGTFDEVQFLGTFSPGFSPAAVNLGSAAYAGTLTIEIGGPTPGSQHDQLNHILGAGVATLGGTLVIDLIDDFDPSLDDTFTVITAAAIDGTFDSVIASPCLEVEYLQDRVIVRAVCGGCPADLNGDGQVAAADLAALLGAWGPNEGSPADLSDDGVVDAVDLAIMLGAWGACDG